MDFNFNRINLRHIKAFCAVYKTGSMNKAASQLRVAQPNVSVSIRNLELDLHTTLFERGVTGVTPTPVAHLFFERLEKALADLEGAHHAVVGAPDDVRGRLRVGVTSLVGETIAPNLLPSLQDRYPNVDIQIIESTLQGLADLTATGELDFALIRSPMDDQRLSNHRLASEPFLLVSNGAEDLPPGPLDLRRAPPLKLVLPWSPTDGRFRTVIDRQIAACEITVNRIVALNALDPIFDLIKCTDWMSLLPVSALVDRFDDLVVREVLYPELMSDFIVIHARGRPISPLSECLLTQMEALIESYAAIWQNRSLH